MHENARPKPSDMSKYSIATILLCLVHFTMAQTTFTVTNTNDAGAGSLRQAILDAEASPGADIVDMTGITGTITLASGLPNIAEDLTINGAGSVSTIIDGNGLYRPFFIGGAGVDDADAPVVVINDLTIQNGVAEGESPQGNAGGGAGMGGAIFINDGDVTLSNVNLTGNIAHGGNGGSSHFGGGSDGGDGPFPNTGGAQATVNIGFVGGTGGYGAGGGGGVYNFNFGGANGGAGGYGAGGGGGGGHDQAPGNGGSAGTFGGSGATAITLGSAGGGGGAGLGGAIYLRNGLLIIENSSLTSNTALRGLGGDSAIEPAGGNGQGKGGAVFNHAGTVYTDNVTLTGNTATSAGSASTDNNDHYGQNEARLTTAITTQPTNLSQNEGDDPSFTVVAEGNDLTYQWQVDDGNGFADVTDGGIYSGATTATLSLTCVTNTLDDYDFRIQISGFVNDVTSDAVTLNVSEVPITVTISGPSETTCSQGEELTFTATPANVYETPTFRWFVDGNEVQGETGSTLTRTSSAGDVITAEVSDPSACFARTPGISDDFTITLGTSPDPEVTITLNTTEICETTDMASFTATPTLGGDFPSFEWRVDGEYWGGGATRDVGGFQDGSIVQVVMTSDDDCLTGATTATATYTVQFGDGPPITQQPVDATAEILGAGSASFSVAATGTGLTYQWQYNRVGGVYEDFTDGDIRNGELTAAGATTSTLNLTQIASNNWHNTQVRCIVSEGTCGTFSDEVNLFFAGGTVIVQNTNNTGAGSLREAVQTANDLSFSSGGVPVGPTTIDLTQVSGTIELESGLFLQGALTITGPGPSNLTIGWSSTGSFGSALIEINSSRSDVTVDISGLTFDGTSNAVSASTGLLFLPTGTNDYTIQNCVFNNFLGYQTFRNGTLSIDGAQFSDYGLSGVNLSGASQVINSTFTNVGKDGINISNASEISIDNVTVTNATQDGIELRADAISVNNSSFYGNGAEGLYINTAGGTGQYQIQNVQTFNNTKSGIRVRFWNVTSDISINEVSSYGNQHGITFHEEAYANATITRSTFSDNAEFGLFIDYDGNQHANLTNVTLANNDYGLFLDGGTLELNNSIVLGNTTRDLFGTVSSSLGHNVYKTRFGNGVEEITGITTGNVVDISVSSVLDAAQTVNDARYYPLLACTPVINAGAPTGASATDQLGNALVDTSDPGAIEFQSAPVPLTVSVSINQVTTDPCPGDLLELTVAPVNGGPDPDYDWYKDGVRFSSAETIFVNVEVGDNYQLEMTTSEGCLVDQQVVTHDFLPDFDDLATITQQPASVTTQSGQNATFSVMANGTALTYQWQASTNNGTSYADLTDGGQISGATTNTLMITGATNNEAGNMYRVRIKESALCDIFSDEVTLNINVVLVVNSLLDNEIVDADLTLREAFNRVVSEAGNNLFTSENPIIIDASGISGTIELLTALPTLTWYTKIVGPSDHSLAISRDAGAADFRIFNLQNSNGHIVKYILKDLVIQNGAATGHGGGINSPSHMDIIDCEISGNTASGSGGGLYLSGSTGNLVSIVDSRISGNSSTGQFDNGGGINLLSVSNLTLENTLVDGNSAEFHGGGIYAGNGGTVEIFNSTFSGNSVSSTNSLRGGGAVHLDLRYSNKIISSTFTGNSSASPALSFNSNFSGTFVPQTLENNILVGNTGQSSSLVYEYNLINDNLLAGSGNIMDSPAELQNLSYEFGSNNLYDQTAANVINLTLADNGGPTLTHALVDCSPAINFIANPSANTPATDATGASRVDETDAGAVEFVGTPTVITDHPEDVTINKTEQAVFTATATSPGTLNYQWQVNTGSGFSDITDDTNYSGSQTTTLTIDDVPESFDGHIYRLNISGSCDNSSDEATLTVENPVPVFSSIPITEATEGVDYFFMADVTDPQGDFLTLNSTTPSWITPRINMVSGPHFSVSGATMAPLTFVEATAPNDGSNRIYSISGSLINSVTITGQDPEQIDISSLNPVASFSPGEITMLNSDELYFAFQYGEDGSSDPLFRIVKFDPTVASPIFNTIKDVGYVADMKVHPDGVVILENFSTNQNIKLISDAGVVTTISTGLSGIPAIDVTPGGKIYYLSEVFGTPTMVSVVELQLNGTTSSTQVLNGEDVYQAMDLIVDDFGRASIRWWKTDMSANLFETVSSYNGIEFEATQDVNSETITGFTRFGLDNVFFISNSGTTSDFMLYADGPVLIGTPSLSDISGNNDVTISADDGDNNVQQAFTINIDFDNDPPTGINISANSIDENNATSTTLLTFTTTDPNMAFDVFTYELVAGAGDTDNTEFIIDEDGLQATIAYDAESNPGDKSIRIRSTDLGGESIEETFTISINDINDTPTAIALSGNNEIGENLAAGTVIGTLTTTDQDAGDSHTYSISGIGSDLFQVVGNELQTADVLDFEQATSYTLTITAEDSELATFDEDFTITIIDDTPTDITMSNSSVDEGLLQGAIVGTFMTTDSDPNNTFTYSFVTGSNLNAFFEIDGDVLKTKGIFDASQFTSASIRVKTTDAIGESFEKDLTITINDLVNSAPQLLNAPANTATQGQLFIFGPGGFDFDGDDLTYTGSGSDWLTQQDQPAVVEEFLSQNGTQKIEIDDDDNLYMTIFGASGFATNILKYDDENETTSSLLSNDATSITFVDIDENGVVYFSDNNFQGPVFELKKIENGTVSTVHFANGDILTGAYHPDGHLVFVEDQGDGTKDIIRVDLDGTNRQTLELEVGFATVFEVGEDENIYYASSTTIHAIDIEGDAQTGISLQTPTSSANPPFLYFIADFVQYTNDESYVLFGVNDGNGGQTEVLVRITANGEEELWRGSVANEASDIAANAKSEVYFTRDSDSDGNNSVAVWNNAFTFFFGTPGDEHVGPSNFDLNVSDGKLSNDYSFVIDVQNVNDAPTGIALSTTSFNENNNIGDVLATFTSDDPDNDSGDIHTYALVSGEGDTDNANFELVGSELKALTSFDHEDMSTRNIRVKATDASNETYEQTFEIGIADLNDAPTAIELSATSINENEVSGTTIGTLSTIDPDATNDNLVFEIIEGADNFQLSGAELQSAASFDFETNVSLTVKVRASDGEENSDSFFTIEETFTISVGDVSESPSDIAISNTSIAENADSGTVIGTLTAQDPDGSNTNTFSLVENSEDNASFSISGEQLVSAEVFNFESKTSYIVDVQVNDGGANTFTEKITITITDVNEAPVFSSASTALIAENTTTAATLAATDVDENATLTYSIVDGADKDLFSLSGTALSFVAAPDFEGSTDADADNDYEITVSVSDGTNNTDQTLVITVTDVNEAPVFSTSAAISVAENSTTVTTLAATDPDAGATLTYSFSGGADQAAFNLSGSSLTFASAPDFESPADADGDNQYEVNVRVSDGTNNTTLSMVITVTDLTTAPAFTSGTETSVTENSTAVITLIASTSEGGGTLTYSLVEGQDAGAFTLDGAVLTFASAPDFENPTDADANNDYELTVQVSDGTSNVEQALTITVTDQNEAPNAINLSSTSVNENADVGTLVGTLTSTDEDGAFSHTYSLMDSESNFIIVGTELRTLQVFDFETQSSFEVTVTVTDEGSLTFDRNFTITVNDLVDNKPNSSIVINSIDDLETGAAAFELSAVTDPEDAVVIWSVVEGDATIDGTTLTPGAQSGLVVVKAVIEETASYNGSEDTEGFSLTDPTLVDPIVTLTLPGEAAVIETVTVNVSFDAQGATTISESDIVLGIESGPGILDGNQLTFTGAGTVVVSASLAETTESNSVYVTDEMEVFQVYSVSGRALGTDGTGFTNGAAFLVASDNFNETLNVLLDTEGAFSFENVKEGEYYLGIGVPQTETTYLSTYLGDKSPVLDPTDFPDVMKLTSDVSGLVINMQSKPAPAVDLIDPATGGKIEFQAQGASDGQNRIILGRVEMGDPIPNTQVVLSTIGGDYIADGLTDEAGFITFEGLPTGDYKIGVEIPGVGRVETEIPVEEGEQADVTGLISEDGTVALEVEEVLNVDLEAKKALTIYPNPVVDQLNLSLENDYRGDLTFSIYDLNGRLVQRFIEEKKTMQFEITRQLEVPEGTYVILIIGKELNLQQRFIKQ